MLPPPVAVHVAVSMVVAAMWTAPSPVAGADPLRAVPSEAACAKSAFPRNLSGIECWGLTGKTTDPMGHPIDSADGCLAVCCADPSCTLWNYATHPPDPPACWVWTKPSMPAECHPAAGGWVGGGGRNAPPPPPPPPPGAPHTIQLPDTAPAAAALPFAFDKAAATSPSGDVVSADSRSVLLNGRRVYHVAGEIHLARVPASQWREQLLRMKSGGLSMIAVYVFWIHHEETRGQFTFTGRRDIRQFMTIAKEVGLLVLLRAGPWDHGECRNGGHPDWVLAGGCGHLRSNDTAYLGCVHGWYAALASQTAGLYWKDGGPIVAVQVDNETSDWKYLLALRALGLSLGIVPAFYTKTGWPAPGPGYPADYPMLPFFGGYADQFWSKSMVPNVSPNAYTFSGTPSVARGDGSQVSATSDVRWDVPAGYPWLDVEIGGGMAAAYNHRVHMDPDDMPAMHLCDVGDGVNQLGYYMYHGGNNPHSLLHHDRDAPETTLQESSFQPSGAANPMPSVSYDFFAPLGEFGQPRDHFHRMRRLHLSVGDAMWGPIVAESVAVSLGTDITDNTTLRWATRTTGLKGGTTFIFVNNYQRLATLAPKTLVRFELQPTSNGTAPAVHVPSVHSEGVTVPPGAWFVWPVGVPLGQCGSGGAIAWATAQLLTWAADGHDTVLFLTETADIQAEVALKLGGCSVVPSSIRAANSTIEGGATVLRGVAAGTTPFVEFNAPDGSTLSLVLLPAAQADRVYTDTVAGVRRVVLAEEAVVVVTDNTSVGIRTDPAAVHNSVGVAVYPPSLTLATAGGTAVKSTADGVFGRFDVPLSSSPAVAVTSTLTKPGGPARDIPLASSHKPREPNSTEWAAAAVYTITLHVPGGGDVPEDMEVRLAIDYAADAARVYFKDRLLTDNWFSGYAGDGACEVGLTYLAGENPGLLSDGASLTVEVLPLKKASLENNIYVQPALWPDFKGKDTVLRINTVTIKTLQYTALIAAPL